MMRETRSVPPPAGNGAIKRMTRLGQACAAAPRLATAEAIADTADNSISPRRVIMRANPRA